MVRGRNIQVSVKGLRPLREPESEIKLPKVDLPDLEDELREHLARRPPNTEPQALAAWVTEKERLQFWITLGRTAAVPPRFERTELPPSPTPAPPAPPAGPPSEPPMPWPTGKKKPPMSEETKQKIRDGRAKQLAKQKAEKADEGRTRNAAPRATAPQVAPPQQMDVDESSRESGGLVRPGLERPYEAAIDLGRAIERHHAAGGRDLEALLLQLQHLQGQVLGITAEAVRMRAEDRAQLLESAANLDALAHQLAQYLATGRIEVAA